ncbi:hypothetical protein [Limimaricola soesokkakensis]
MLANHLKMLRPEPWVDRRVKASGNWMALGDLLHGRAQAHSRLPGVSR